MENQRQTRRIQISGGSTYIVSLPKRWINDLKINAGDNITITKNSNVSLTLYPQGGGKSKETAVIIPNRKDTGESIKRKIIAVYLDGYNSIRIASKGGMMSPDHAKSIRELVRTSMIGTEIVESSSKEITIQILSRLPELSFETALERMYLMACNMIREAIESLEEMDRVHADEVVNMDDEVDRFGLYMRRSLVLAVSNKGILQEVGLRKSSECLGYKAIISKIERIADHACLIAKRTKFIKTGIDVRIMTKIKVLSQRVIEVFEMSIGAVQEHDFEKGERVAGNIVCVIDEEKQIMHEIKETEKYSTALRFVLEDLRRIAEYSSDIAEVAIDENIQNVILEE